MIFLYRVRSQPSESCWKRIHSYQMLTAARQRIQWQQNHGVFGTPGSCSRLAIHINTQYTLGGTRLHFAEHALLVQQWVMMHPLADRVEEVGGEHFAFLPWGEVNLKKVSWFCTACKIKKKRKREDSFTEHLKGKKKISTCVMIDLPPDRSSGVLEPEQWL